MHKPVLLTEVLEHLQPRDGEVYVDATFGAGGYTTAILQSANCLPTTMHYVYLRELTFCNGHRTIGMLIYMSSIF